MDPESKDKIGRYVSVNRFCVCTGSLSSMVEGWQEVQESRMDMDHLMLRFMVS